MTRDDTCAVCESATRPTVPVALTNGDQAERPIHLCQRCTAVSLRAWALVGVAMRSSS